MIAALERPAEVPPPPPFPDAFLRGAAAAAMQVEGGIEAMDWQTFTTDPIIKTRVEALAGAAREKIDLRPPAEAIRHGDIGVLQSDLDRAKALGMNAYRFSIEWARVQPTAERIDEDALARVLDELDSRGLTPIVTISHLSLPLWVLTPPRTFLADPGFTSSLGGWSSTATVDAFLRFVELVADRFGSRIQYCLTLNEPVGSVVGVGYIGGLWPPGFVGQGDMARKALFNLIRAHVRAYDAIKQRHPQALVGFAHAMLHTKTSAAAAMPFGQEVAARNQFDYFYNWHFLNAVILGKIDVNITRRPHDQALLTGRQLEEFLGLPTGHADPWRPRCDFFGINYYRSVYVFYDAAVSLAAGFAGGRTTSDLGHPDNDEPHHLLNGLGWEVSSAGLGLLLPQFHARYGLPVLITENGMAEASDQNRAPYIVGQLEQVLHAIGDGVRVLGYLCWTLADNWEWHRGYLPEARFGLFTVDRADQTRHITNSALALRYLISEGDLRGAAERFGIITPAGDRVRAGRRSTATVLEGRAVDEPSGQALAMTIYFLALERGGMSGLLRLRDGQGDEQWLPLQQVDWDAVTGNVRFLDSKEAPPIHVFKGRSRIRAGRGPGRPTSAADYVRREE